MKKLITTLVAIALVLALGACAMAEGWTMYVMKNDVKVYKSASTKAKVLTKMNGNDAVKVVFEDGECYKCSKCGDFAFTCGGEPRFCPECGAKVVDK